MGLAIAEAFLARGWHVVGTVRSGPQTMLHALRERWPDRLEIETVDVTIVDQIGALRSRLEGKTFDLLLVNAGVANDSRETIADVATAEFVRVMVTNALSPMRAIEALRDLVDPNGTIAVMSSGQGSVANNERGGVDVYRASKAAQLIMKAIIRRSASPRHQLAS